MVYECYIMNRGSNLPGEEGTTVRSDLMERTYCILRNILHEKYFACKIFRNLRHDYVNCCFGLKLWYFAHKKTSKKKDNSYIINMITTKMICMVFWLCNSYLKILELFYIVQKS